ncbi:MAG: homocysteine S-methyltransferase family protein [Ilumatobacteraceae bacterium]
MTPRHSRTPWPTGSLTVTDAGIETWLAFQQHIELPEFAAYPLAATDDGRRVLREYFQHYLAIADTLGTAVELDSATWRANPDWAAKLGHDHAMLRVLIFACVQVLHELRGGWASDRPFIIGGTVGPRADGYVARSAMEAVAALDYHSFQVDCLAAAGVDVVTAMTIGYVEEAIGITLAAQAAALPAVISFTVETDGRLPSGMALAEAIGRTEEATDGYPHHYMLNCAHPAHFAHILEPGSRWTARIGGLRVNASRLSHGELAAMDTLDDGDPDELAADCLALRHALPGLQVIGGCCGTDQRHVAAIAHAWSGPAAHG